MFVKTRARLFRSEKSFVHRAAKQWLPFPAEKINWYPADTQREASCAINHIYHSNALSSTLCSDIREMQKVSRACAKRNASVNVCRCVLGFSPLQIYKQIQMYMYECVRVRVSVCVLNMFLWVNMYNTTKNVYIQQLF